MAQPNAGSCYFGCNGDPYLCYLLGFLFPTNDFGKMQIVPCSTSCSAGTGRWGGMQSSWHHCLNYTRPIPDDCSILEGGFNVWNVKRTVCSSCPFQNCNEPSLEPTSVSPTVWPTVILASATSSSILFSVSLKPIGTVVGVVSGTVGVQFHNSTLKGPVCADNGWTLLDASVVCKQLGLGVALRAYAAPVSPMIAAIGRVACTGTEGALEECLMSVNNQGVQCFSEAAVYCSGPVFGVSSPLVGTDNISGILSAAVGDVNGDGLVDIFVASFSEGNIGWFRNLGSGKFASFQVLIKESFPLAIALGDMDNDGYLDFIYTTTSGVVGIFKNTGNPNNTFLATPIIVANGMLPWNSIALLDHNNDGLLDIVLSVYWYYNFLYQHHSVQYFLNRGNNTFTGPTVIQAYPKSVGPITVYAFDVDENGYNDILVLQPFTNTLSFFSQNAGVWMVERTIALGDPGLLALDVCDVDGDGVSDIVVAAYRDDSVGWHRQIAQGKFGERIIIGALPSVKSVSCADVNFDGTNDILAVGLDSDSALWFENTGSGEFISPHVLSTSLGRPSTVIAADIDGDGDKDIVAMEYHGTGVHIFTNLLRSSVCTDMSNTCGLGWTCVNNTAVCSTCKDGYFLSGTSCLPCPVFDHCLSMVCTTRDVYCTKCENHFVLSSRGECNVELFYSTDINIVNTGTQYMYSAAADFDNDGLLDILSVTFYDIDPGSNPTALGGRIEMAWGTSQFTYDRVILTRNAPGARNLDIVDINKDGYLDFFVVYQLSNTVACWYVTPGRVVTEKAFGHTYLSPYYIRAYDMDGNGYPDAVVSFTDNQMLVIYLNFGGTTFSVVAVSSIGVFQQFALNDLDDDGNMDIVAAVSTPGKVVWLRNTGGLNFVPITIVEMAALAVTVGCVTTGRSGCHDIFFSASVAYAIIHCRLSSASTNYTFSCDAVVEHYADVQSLDLTDINNDGAPDLLFSSLISNSIAYLENMDQKGTFGVPYIISNNVDRVHHAFPKDMDGDGDIDILVACDLMDLLYWYPNRLIDHQPPKISCPSVLMTNNTKGKAYGAFAEPCTCVASVSVCSTSYYLQPSNVAIPVFDGVLMLSVGAHNITFHAIDIHGNVASTGMTVVVYDTEAPAISLCLRNVVAASTGAAVTLSVTDFGDAVTSDNVGVTRTTLVRGNSSASGLTFGIGQWPLVYTAYDAANNSVWCALEATVFLLTVPRPVDIVEGVLFQQSFVSFSNISRTSNFVFTLTDSSKIPTGLFLNDATGVLSGVVSDTASASELGTHGPFTLTITDTSSSNTNLSKFSVGGVSMLVLPALVFYEPSATTQFAPMPRLNPTVKGGAGNYSFSYYTDVGPLVPGVTIHPDSGSFIGRPLEAGHYSITVVVTDMITKVAQLRDRIELEVLPGLNSSWTVWPTEQAVEVNTAFHGPAMVLTGGQMPYVFTFTGGPAGLTIENGRVAGTPTVQGTFSVIVSITDAHAATLSLPAFALTVKPSSQSSASVSTAAVVIPIVILSVFFAAALALLFFVMWRKRERKKAMRPEIKEILEKYIQPFLPRGGVAKEPEELSPDDIRRIKTLGAGHFGSVFKATYTRKDKTNALVAVKELQEMDMECHDLLKEACLMAQFKHKNVLVLYGITFNKDSELDKVKNVGMVVNFCEEGDLLNFLHAKKGLKNGGRARICCDIASGMEYLGGFQFVHRDLAARNIVITSHFEFQVSDFGLSRPLRDGQLVVYSEEECSVRWAAPEAFIGRYYQASDVWSFGVVAFEVYSGGESPYSDIVEQEDVREAVLGGRRLRRPQHCPPEVFELLDTCWDTLPERRPSFHLLAEKFREWSDNDFTQFNQESTEPSLRSMQHQYKTLAELKADAVNGNGTTDLGYGVLTPAGVKLQDGTLSRGLRLNGLGSNGVPRSALYTRLNPQSVVPQGYAKLSDVKALTNFLRESSV